MSTRTPASRRARDSAVIWHDVECGAYAADLPVWEELGERCGGPVLDLGCGTGRVALHLARRGHRVLGLDSDPDLLSALAKRAGELPVEAELGDARGFDLGTRFGLALAPMQLLQLLGDVEERIRCLRCVAAHLRPGGLAAAAIVERLPEANPGPPPLPDTHELDGWVYSSLPLESAVEDGSLAIRRLRQVVAPDGELGEDLNEVRLRVLDAATLEREAAAAGLRPAGRREIPSTGEHVGSTVVVLAREA